MAKAPRLKKLLRIVRAVCAICSGFRLQNNKENKPPDRVAGQHNLLLHETAMRSAANTIVITDAAGIIQWVNPAFTRATGYTFEEAIGNNPRILKSGHQDHAFYQNLWETILQGAVWRGVFINRRKDGTLVHEESTITPVLDQDGAIVNFIAIKQDVTERVRVERELQEAKLKAEAASQAKSDFLAIMSHEIRTPLNVVLGILELLRDSPVESTHREQIRLAMGSGKTLLYLINDILDYSKIEASQLVLDIVPFEIHVLLDDVIQAMTPLAQEKQIVLSSHFPTHFHATLQGDPNRLRQIFTNLIGNAIKFTPRGGSIDLLGGPVRQEPEWIEYLFEIRDTGIGILEQDREHIFERFVQANTSTTRQYGGTGLGLTICQRLIELMDGTIGVEHNPAAQTGSCFHFTARFQKKTQPLSPSRSSAPQPASSMGRGTFGDARILIVDDQSANLAVTLGMLVKIGCDRSHCRTADNGEQAVERFRSQLFDLVFMDCQMPVMDGYQATRLIREWELLQGSPPTPVIALTADVTQANRIAGQSAGMNDFLAKPVGLGELRNMLQRHLGNLEAEPERLKESSSPVLPALATLFSLGLEEDEIPNIARLICTQIPELLDSMEQDLNSDRTDHLRVTAHTLRGSMLHTIFPEMLQVTGALHAAVRAQAWEEVREHLKQTRLAFVPIRDALLVWLEGQTGNDGNL
ncbi:MAG: response regulator [Magnetococcales bacterium]|nr:response regulator [Magnetococcales bacterium]